VSQRHAWKASITDHYMTLGSSKWQPSGYCHSQPARIICRKQVEIIKIAINLNFMQEFITITRCWMQHVFWYTNFI